VTGLKCSDVISAVTSHCWPRVVY